MAMKTYLKTLFFALMLFCGTSYGSEKNSLVEACVKGCWGNADSYSKLSKPEQEKANNIIAICVNSCMESAKKISWNEKSLNTSENGEDKEQKQSDNDETDKNEKDGRGESPERQNSGWLFNMGIGSALPISKYAYTGVFDIGYGSIGGAGFISLEHQMNDTFIGIETFFARLSDFTTYKYVNPVAVSIRSHAESQAVYWTFKYSDVISKYDVYTKFGFGYAKTTVYADFNEYIPGYSSIRESDSNSTEGPSLYFAIGSSLSSKGNVGWEGRMSFHKYEDKTANDVSNWQTHHLMMYSVMFWLSFGDLN